MMENKRLDTHDALISLLDQVDAALKVIDSGLFDVTADTVAVVRLRELADELSSRLDDDDTADGAA